MRSHTPVLLTTVLDLLKPVAGESTLDVTLGLGGHSEAFLQATQPSGTLVGIDADEQNLRTAAERLSPFGKRVTLIHANFSALPHCLQSGATFDIIVADLGISSPHLDDPERGFSFRQSSPLDMRYDRSSGMHTAAQLLKTGSPTQLTHIFQEYGELPRTHRLVKSIVEQRKIQNIATADDLLHIAKAVYGYTLPSVLPQMFQALRIAVNDEMASLERLLSALPGLLSDKGRAAIITYHSLEDRLVKQAFRTLTCVPRHPETGQDIGRPIFALLTKKPLSATQEEIENNPRSRSAHLRAIAKLPVPL